VPPDGDQDAVGDANSQSSSSNGAQSQAQANNQQSSPPALGTAHIKKENGSGVGGVAANGASGKSKGKGKSNQSNNSSASTPGSAPPSTPSPRCQTPVTNNPSPAGSAFSTPPVHGSNANPQSNGGQAAGTGNQPGQLMSSNSSLMNMATMIDTFTDAQLQSNQISSTVLDSPYSYDYQTGSYIDSRNYYGQWPTPHAAMGMQAQVGPGGPGGGGAGGPGGAAVAGVPPLTPTTPTAQPQLGVVTEKRF